MVTIIITAHRRVCWGAYSNSLNKALIGPLAQKSAAGFLFLGSILETWDSEDRI
jgi:hypothetical protein